MRAFASFLSVLAFVVLLVKGFSSNSMMSTAEAVTTCINTITVPFPKMDRGTYTVYMSTALQTTTVDCAKGCLLRVATAKNPYPEPTKTVTSQVTTRTVHACKPKPLAP
jgi:hypothetical protein